VRAGGGRVGAQANKVLHELHSCIAGADPLPDRITAIERLDEVARLLALGYLRLRARRQQQKTNEPNRLSRFGLDFRVEGSVSDTDTHAD
jgi:hypothetical protein